MNNLDIRHETPSDILAVRAVNEAAFETGAEAALVDTLRENGKFVLSLVADVEGEIVGHILFTDIAMEPGGAATRMIGLAPMAVRPEWQGKGIGSALVRRGLEDCRELGYRGVVVLGHPGFYPRFGFAPASRHGISCAYDAPDEAFMALALGDVELPKGRALYQPEFEAV
ncbi:MAG: N-acetyltransferase [Alphaproteobacteria bacterium]|nr:N-acetyltransferase [Alphaproteobacteria bacterium]